MLLSSLLQKRLLVVLFLGFSSFLEGQIIQGNIKPEYLLSSIRKNYCAIQLFDPNGVELKTNRLSSSMFLEEIDSFFDGNYTRIRFISDSSSFLQQQALHWNIAASNALLYEHCWTIVCYSTKSNAVDAQLFRQEHLKALQQQHPGLPIQLVFIQQDL
ncbi:MAG: hypothetical protein RLZZ543_733 [Bacteroidota bacterium]|jgi:hypothetical protein